MLGLTLFLFLGTAPLARADDPQSSRSVADGELTGLEAARRMDDASRSKTEHTVITMTLANTRGQRRVRSIEAWAREIRRDEEYRFGCVTILEYSGNGLWSLQEDLYNPQEAEAVMKRWAAAGGRFAG